MAIELQKIEGIIELKDEFSSRLGLAEAVLSNFTKENQKSLLAVAGAAGLVTAAFTATAAAAVALGIRGSEVNSVAATLDHFAGSAEAANLVMEKLRAGTKGTVDNFVLAKDAAQLLSTGVKLTANDFGTLGQAAFVLQNRGLGSTKEMLDLVSDALTTGRTKALAMAVGVVDAGDAEANFAKKLGITKDLLSESGKVEAKRIAVMEILGHAVKDAGAQERDFAAEITAAGVAVQNWVDDLGSAIAKSPILAAGLREAGAAVAAAFGAGNGDLIQDIVHGIEKAAVVAVDFGLGTIELARVVNVVWSGIKTGILSVETAIVGVVDALATAALAAAQVAEKAGVGTAENTAAMQGFRDSIREVTVGLALETAEAAKGIVGHSAFDKTLDKLGGTLFAVKDAMESASKAIAASTEANGLSEASAKKLEVAQKQLTASLIDRGQQEIKLAAIEKKSVEETKILWNEYFALRAEHSTSAFAASKADIDKWAANEVAKLDSLDRNWKKHYDAIQSVAHEKLQSITIDWNTLHEKSLTTLREQAEVARNTYNEMQRHASEFTREAMDEQLKKTKEAEAAARGMGTAYKDALDKAAVAAQTLTDKLKAAKDAADAAKKANLDMGGSFEITRENFAASARGLGANPDVVEQLLKKGYSFQQALLYSKHPEWPPPANPGPRVPGFKEGGTVMVGEDGPEVVRLPFGSQVFPNGMMPTNGGGDEFNITVHVNGTEQEVAGKVARELMRQLKMRRQFGAA